MVRKPRGKYMRSEQVIQSSRKRKTLSFSVNPRSRMVTRVSTGTGSLGGVRRLDFLAGDPQQEEDRIQIGNSDLDLGSLLDARTGVESDA